jgi:hypothetical protein
MISLKLYRVALLAFPLLLSACAPSAQQQADLAAVRTSGVPSATYDKMVHGDELSISDVCALERAQVDEGVMLRYMRERGTIYVLSSNDTARLEKAGVSQSVIDYMQHTEVASAVSYPTTTVITYAPYGPIGYYGPSATSYWGPRYYGAYDPFFGPPY